MHTLTARHHFFSSPTKTIRYALLIRLESRNTLLHIPCSPPKTLYHVRGWTIYIRLLCWTQYIFTSTSAHNNIVTNRPPRTQPTRTAIPGWFWSFAHTQTTYLDCARRRESLWRSLFGMEIFISLIPLCLLLPYLLDTSAPFAYMELIYLSILLFILSPYLILRDIYSRCVLGLMLWYLICWTFCGG